MGEKKAFDTRLNKWMEADGLQQIHRNTMDSSKGLKQLYDFDRETGNTSDGQVHRKERGQKKMTDGGE